ncbi:MAG: hypothetical protein K2Q26_02640 [Bdellovibrionales bacterium]|nr:hypothetical protein [Bdellovibrionales bacterium]
MKLFFYILTSLAIMVAFQNCGEKGFSANGASGLPSDDIGLDVDLGDPSDDPLNCPRFDVVFKSVHSSNPTLNYVFKFNGEVTHTSTQGVTTVQFLQDASGKRLTQCSGSYNNSSILASMKPLKVVEELTANVAINHTATCSSQARTTYITIVDGATGELLYDENQLRSELGCQFEYTSTGDALYNQLKSLADGVVNAMAASCNK